MDVLAAFESSLDEDENSFERDAFYGLLHQIAEKVNVIDRSSMIEDDIFYWANLLRIRELQPEDSSVCQFRSEAVVFCLSPNDFRVFSFSVLYGVS